MSIVASKKFREKLVKMVQEAGQELIDRAEDLVGNGDQISDFDIWIRFPINEPIGFPEIEMGIHHQELGLPWDQPVPEELWVKVAEYCDNDVLATEAAFNYLKAESWSVDDE